MYQVFAAALNTLLISTANATATGPNGQLAATNPMPTNLFITTRRKKRSDLPLAVRADILIALRGASAVPSASNVNIGLPPASVPRKSR